MAIYESRIINKVNVGKSRLYVFEELKVRTRAGISDRRGFNLNKANLMLHGSGRTFYRVNPRHIRAKADV